MKVSKQKIAFLTLILAFVLTGFSQAQTIGEKAPDFTVKTLKGDTFTLSEQTDKVVFVFLFGNTCSHCLANGPNTQSHIYSVFKEYDDFVAIGIDVWDGSSNLVQSFKNRTGIKYQIGLKGSSVASAYSSTYDRMLVIDQRGILQYKSTANARSSIVAEAAELIESIVGQTSGINDIILNDVEHLVFPNPATDIATIQTDYRSGIEVQLHLMDLSGRLLIDEEIEVNQSGQISMDIKDYPAGMYFIRTRSGIKSTSSRFIIR